MNIVIYIFAISAFALGLAEFLPIGLTDIIAKELGVSVEQVGTIVTAYALGATFSAPILAALTMNWSRKQTLLITTFVFSLGSLAAALAYNLNLMVVARFIAGVGHGLFLAVASSTAAKLAGANRAGMAVAIVFGGFTVAMAIGVPVSTWLGGIVSWRIAMATIGVFGAIGFIGLLFGMKDTIPTLEKENPFRNIRMLFNPTLLNATLVTVFSYAGSFTTYTYITPYLMQITGVDINSLGVFMLIYGVAAAGGNILGGKMTDRMGELKANILIISGIIVTSVALWLFAESAVIMSILVGMLGMLTFAVVPSLQARLIKIAEQTMPNAHGVASGLNIAGFNSGIALGSVIGGGVIAQYGINFIALIGGIVSLIGLGLLVFQLNNKKQRAFYKMETL